MIFSLINSIGTRNIGSMYVNKHSVAYLVTLVSVMRAKINKLYCSQITSTEVSKVFIVTSQFVKWLSKLLCVLWRRWWVRREPHSRGQQFKGGGRCRWVPEWIFCATTNKKNRHSRDAQRDQRASEVRAGAACICGHSIDWVALRAAYQETRAEERMSTEEACGAWPMKQSVHKWWVN